MNHEIYLRCHTRILEARKPAQRQAKQLPKWPEHVLVLDTETTKDDRQKLNFGVYRFCKAAPDGRYTCLEEGLFHGDLNEAQINVLQAYASNMAASTVDGYSRKLKLYNRSEFLEK